VARPRLYHLPRVTTAVRLSPELRDRLHQAAAAEGRSVNQLVVQAVSDYLRRAGGMHRGGRGR
jgi:predicted transcriptional regulator